MDKIYPYSIMTLQLKFQKSISQIKYIGGSILNLDLKLKWGNRATAG